jgi:hypothetical protein
MKIIINKLEDIKIDENHLLLLESKRVLYSVYKI